MFPADPGHASLLSPLAPLAPSASPGTRRLRLVTFNVAHGRGLTPIQGLTSRRKLRLNLRRIAALLEGLGADVVALQEVDECSVWAGSFDHLDYLKVHARFAHSLFGINNLREGLVNLRYGNALLSRFALGESQTVVFGNRRFGEKGFLYAELEVGGWRVPLINLHLHFASRVQRLRQLGRLVAWLKVKEAERGRAWSIAPIVCGDFNNPGHTDDATAALLSHLSDYADYSVYPQGVPTFPSPIPRRMLDFVFVPAPCRVVHWSVVKTLLSDHRPVALDLLLEKA